MSKKSSDSNKLNWICSFTITEYKRHRSKDFMVYKVTSRMFQKNNSDSVTILTVWKRFNDFKKLYKELQLIHSKLYLKGEFPTDFPLKAKYFGRFDIEVVEERKKACLNLLNFAGQIPQLFSSKIFVKFFQEGYNEDDLNHHQETTSNNNFPTEEEEKNLTNCLVPERLWKKTDEDENDNSNSQTDSSFAEDSNTNADCDSLLNLNENEDIVNDVLDSNLQLPKTRVQNLPKSISEFDLDLNSVEGPVTNGSAKNTLTSSKSFTSSDFPISSQGSSKQEAIDENNRKEDPKSTTSGGFFDFLPIFSTKNNTESSTSTNTTSTTENDLLNCTYIRESAGYFTIAQQYESNCEYRNTFNSLKEGIKILINGVQFDEDSKRKILVTKKLKKYLIKAETLHSTFLQNDNEESKSKIVTEIREFENDKKFPKPSSIELLKNFKVVRVLNSKQPICVIDTKDSSKLYSVKVLPKASNELDTSQESILPTDVPFMAPLKLWFNLEHSIVLILGYVRGGLLSDFIKSYQYKEIPRVTYKEGEDDNFGDAEEIKDDLELFRKCLKLNESNEARGSELMNQHQGILTNQENNFVRQNSNISNKCNDNDKEKMVSWKNLQRCNTRELIDNSKLLLKTVSTTLSLAQKQEEKNIADDIQQQAQKEPLAEGNNEGINQINLLNYIPKEEEDEDDYLSIDDENMPLRLVPVCCIRIWASELVLALEKIHSIGLIYGDLDMKNILLGENGHISLSYKCFWNEVDIIKLPNYRYSSPEVYSGSAINQLHPSADWFSFGSILFELLTGKTFESQHPEGFYQNTILKIPDKNICNESISTDAKTLLIELLQFNPNLRLGFYGAEEIKSHPFFSDFDWERALNESIKS